MDPKKYSQSLLIEIYTSYLELCDYFVIDFFVPVKKGLST